MNENAVGDIVLGCAIKVHKVLGPGLLEGAELFAQQASTAGVPASLMSSSFYNPGLSIASATTTPKFS